eukprot:5963861-Amphidinium_carterae.1
MLRSRAAWAKQSFDLVVDFAGRDINTKVCICPQSPPNTQSTTNQVGQRGSAGDISAIFLPTWCHIVGDHGDDTSSWIHGFDTVQRWKLQWSCLLHRHLGYEAEEVHFPRLA